MALSHICHGIGTFAGRNLGGEVFAGPRSVLLYAVPVSLRDAVPYGASRVSGAGTSFVGVDRVLETVEAELSRSGPRRR